MSADFNNPTVDDQYTEILPQIRDNQAANAVMFNNVVATNIPVNAVQFVSGQFNLWDGGAWNVQPVAIAGGGTGATDAATARANLGLSSKTEADVLYLKVLSNGADIDDKSIFRTELNVPSNSEASLNSDNLSNMASAADSFNNIKQAATELDSGVLEIASQAEAVVGVVDNRMMTPLKTVNLLDTYTPAPVEIWSGIDTTVTPAEILADTGFAYRAGTYFVVNQEDGDIFTIEIPDDSVDLVFTNGTGRPSGAGTVDSVHFFQGFRLSRWTISTGVGVGQNIVKILFRP